MPQVQFRGQSYIPPRLAQGAKRLITYPRYWLQVRRCRRGFRVHGIRYPAPMIFVAGLPKSGTSWFEGMLASYPGYALALLPEAILHELDTGAPYAFELPVNFFARFKDMLVVTKMHVAGSKNNAAVLHSAGAPYAIVYRDLRDVAVSFLFYVRRTPWQPHHALYARLPVEEGLLHFADTTLPAYADWVRTWEMRRDPHLSIVVRYEALLADPHTVMTRVSTHFGLPSSPDDIDHIVSRHSFPRLRATQATRYGGGEFFRKGMVGDWRNHFTPRVTERFKNEIGQFLVDLGYERDLSW